MTIKHRYRNLRTKVIAKIQRNAANDNNTNRKHRRKNIDKSSDKYLFQIELNKMSNWQRNKWVSAGSPGIGINSFDSLKLEPFIKLERKKHNVVA